MEIQGFLGKLRYRPGLKATILNSPRQYEEAFKAAGFATSLQIGSELTLLFVRNIDELKEHFMETINIVGETAVFWVVYPKGTSGVKSHLNRDVIWSKIKPFGWRPVSLVALDEVWSAMRVKPERLVH